MGHEKVGHCFTFIQHKLGRKSKTVSKVIRVTSPQISSVYWSVSLFLARLLRLLL